MLIGFTVMLSRLASYGKARGGGQTMPTHHKSAPNPFRILRCETGIQRRFSRRLGSHAAPAVNKNILFHRTGNHAADNLLLEYDIQNQNRNYT